MDGKRTLARRKGIGRQFRALQKDASGLAAIEFALIAGFLAIGMLNVADTAVFMVQKLQVNDATQMAAQAVWSACDLNHLPAASKCPGMSAAATAALHSTSLGSAVTIQTGYPLDAYFCPNTSGVLQNVGSYSNPPADCTAAGNGGQAPGEYVNIRTTYSYTPMIPGMAVVSVLPHAITASGWVRLK